MNSLKTSPPLSMQVADIIRDRIKNGDLESGQRLKSIRDMAAEFSVGRQVIVSAFDILTREGVLIKKPGCGVFVKDLRPLKNKVFRIGFYINNYDFSKRFHSNLLTMLNAKSETDHCEIIPGTSKNNPDPAKWVKRGEIDGILLSGKVDDDIVKTFDFLEVPFVIIGNYKLTHEANTVEIDYKSAFEKVFTELLDRHKIRTIGMISGSDKEYVNIYAAKAIKKVIHNNKLDNDNDDSFFYMNAEEDGYKAMENFIAEKHKLPDALFISSQAFWGAAKFLLSHGCSAPGKRPVIVGENYISETFRDLLDAVLYFQGKNLASTALERILGILKSPETQTKQRKKVAINYAFANLGK